MMPVRFSILMWFMFITGIVTAQQDFVPGALYVKTIDGYNAKLGKSQPPFSDGTISATDFGITHIEPAFPLLDDKVLNQIFKIKLDKHDQVRQLIELLQGLPYVEYAEAIPVYYTSQTPNDYQSGHWHLPKINAEQAWNITTGPNDVVVAIVDDAVLLSHEDLAPNIWTNPGEIPNNNIDDDHNGFKDDVHGWDVADNDNDPNPPAATVSNSNFTHGTHCAGIAAAATNNNKGVAAVSYNVHILPVKTKLSSTSGGSLQATHEGVEYAIHMGADIISMSFGSYFSSLSMKFLIEMAHRRGITFFGAAGNNNTDFPLFPASYDYVISVGATDINDNKAWFSNYGSAIDLMAPGVDIYSALAGTDSSYGVLSGTSMACPLAAGLGALLLSHNPYYEPDDLELLLKQSAVNIDALNPTHAGVLGAGRINAFAAASDLKPLLARFTSDVTFVCTGDTVRFTQSSTNNPTSLLWSFPGGTPSTSVQSNPVVIYSTPGVYQVVLIAVNSDGADTLTRANYITAGVPSALLSGTQTIYGGSNGLLKIEFIGNPPFSVTYSNGSGNFNVNGIHQSPYILNVAPTQTTTYSLVSYSDRNCTGTVSGTPVVTVDPNPAPCGYLQSFQKSPFQFGRLDLLDLLTEIGDVDGNGVTDLAMGASFDDDGGIDKGAIFIFFFNPDRSVRKIQKISELQGNLPVVFRNNDNFGSGIGHLGDLDGNGVDEIAVGAPGDSDLGSGAGAIYVLFLDTNGTVLRTKKILAPEFASNTTRGFGRNIWGMGDIDKDGVSDLVSTTHILYDASGTPIGIDEIYILFLKPDGSLKRYIEYNESAWYLQNQNILSQAFNIRNIGDIDGNGVNDCLANSTMSDSVNPFYSVMRIFFLDSAGAIIDTSSIRTFNDPGIVMPTEFGAFTTGIGDIDLDGVPDLAITDVFGTYHVQQEGALYIAFLNRDGSVKSYQKITNGSGGLPSGTLPPQGLFGLFPVPLGDIDGDGGLDMAILGGDSSSIFFYMIDLVNCRGGCSVQAAFVGDTVGCISYAMPFADNSATATGQINFWEWSFGDGTISTLQNPTHAYSSPGTYSVRLVAGTTQPPCTDTFTRQVVVGDSFSIVAPGNVQVCTGDSVALPLDIMCGIEPLQYQWSGLSANIRNPVVRPTITTTYHVTVTNGSGATATRSVTVSIDNSCCTSHAGITQLQPEDCYNRVKRFTNNSLARTSATYQWFFGAAATPQTFLGPNPPQVSFASSGLYEVKLIVNDACGADTAIHQLLIFEKPEIELRDTALCSADSIRVGVEALAGFSYNWSPATGISDPHAATPWFKRTGIYVLTASDDWTGCVTKDTVQIESGTMDSTSGFIYSINGLDVSFTDTITSAHTAFWDFGDFNGYSSDLNPDYYYTQPGNYKVCLTITGCASFITCETITVWTGIVSPDDFAMELFPNPATNQLMLLLNGMPASEISLSMFNALGQQVDFNSTQKGNTYTLDLSKLSSGLYYLKVQADKRIEVKSFVKAD